MAERTPIARFERMSRVSSRNTKPEMIVRRGLHAPGYRYRLHVRVLLGSPDLVLPRYSAVVLVNGCFWHTHEGCKNFRFPKSNSEFWKEKLIRNIERDQEQIQQLNNSGWRVLVVWECATRGEHTKKIDRSHRGMVAWLHGCMVSKWSAQYQPNRKTRETTRIRKE